MAIKISSQLYPKLTQTFTIASFLALVSVAAISQPSYAGRTEFYCAAEGGEYFTFVRTEDGERHKVMGWISTYSYPNMTPKQRCQQVSTRFQRNYDNGTLKRIASGKVKKETVICSGIDVNTVCDSSNLLFTLKPGEKGKEVAQKLFNSKALAGAEIIIHNSNRDDIMFDFDLYLDHLPREKK